MMAQASNPSTQKLKSEEKKFKTILGYIVMFEASVGYRRSHLKKLHSMNEIPQCVPQFLLFVSLQRTQGFNSEPDLKDSHRSPREDVYAVLIVVSLVTGWSEAPAVGIDRCLKINHLIKCVRVVVYSGCLCSKGCP